MLNPTQDLSELNLDRYTILDCEPLHDLKGHLSNLFDELPKLLTKEQEEKCLKLIKSKFGQKVSGADMRAAVIDLFLLLCQENSSEAILDLLLSIIKISQILYMDEEKRSPKMVLRLYNCAWYHVELCRELISQPKTMTTRKMYGIYLHSLIAHAPRQYELISQKSTNTENQERLFGQARRATLATSNRHAENIVITILLRLQAKKASGQTLHSVNEADSQVSKAAANLPKCKQTEIHKTFIATRMHSWQAHLEQISHYLVKGKGIWWKDDENKYYFFDGDDDPNCHPQGPILLHFRSASLKDVEHRHKKT